MEVFVEAPQEEETVDVVVPIQPVPTTPVTQPSHRQPLVTPAPVHNYPSSTSSFGPRYRRPTIADDGNKTMMGVDFVLASVVLGILVFVATAYFAARPASSADQSNTVSSNENSAPIAAVENDPKPTPVTPVASKKQVANEPKVTPRPNRSVPVKEHKQEAKVAASTPPSTKSSTTARSPRRNKKEMMRIDAVSAVSSLSNSSSNQSNSKLKDAQAPAARNFRPQPRGGAGEIDPNGAAATKAQPMKVPGY